MSVENLRIEREYLGQPEAFHICIYSKQWSGYDDPMVEGVYEQLDDHICEVRRQNRRCIFVGDWNTVVGLAKSGMTKTSSAHMELEPETIEVIGLWSGRPSSDSRLHLPSL